jgi:hypothetical protein
LDIEIPQPTKKDRLAWHFEKNGIFSVRSAYRLALSLKHQNRDSTSCSQATEGERPIWNLIWKSNVQPKIKVFGWRVAIDSLAIRKNKWRRTLEVNDQCSICGMADEDAFHATVACTKARVLCEAMRGPWNPPGEQLFRNTGTDWLQTLLGQVDELIRSRIASLARLAP